MKSSISRTLLGLLVLCCGEPASEAPVPQSGPTALVVVAARDLVPGDALFEDEIALGLFPMNDLRTAHFTSLNAIESRLVLRTVSAGQPIYAEDLAATGHTGVRIRIDPPLDPPGPNGMDSMAPWKDKLPR